MNDMRRIFWVGIMLLAGCTEKTTQETPVFPDALFQKQASTETGLSFVNALQERKGFDVFRYRNYYNGGGVGIADFNNDGLADIYFTSNMGENKLYLNKGNWKFEDITEKAGVKGSKVWSTGVSVADVNGDGLLDIYVSNAGDVEGGNRENELFINNGNLTFTEQATAYGLADKGFTTHAAFFDYDKDGDLDCYVLNNSWRPVSSLGYRNLRGVRDPLGGHKLYRNDNNHFIDVSEETGIYGSVIGFGLGVTVGDVNQDGWSDIYVSNDFYERDYLYINNQKGGFDERLEECMDHISMFSMGADVADLTNDGYPEIFSTDMLPEDDYRLKTLISFETYETYQLRFKNGYYHQYMRNMLQLNNQDNTFSEIGYLAGVAATDWSWAALMADFNNDQFKEILVCNGIYKDLIDQDFVEFLGSGEQRKLALDNNKVDFKGFVDKMPSTQLRNYLFTRQSHLRYQNVAEEWGLGEKGFSNGAAYGDLDNDGDLDLVISNLNAESSVYRNMNQEQHPDKHYIAFTFKGKDKNTFALGADVKVYSGQQILSFEQMPIRGFQSSMDYKMVVGLGDRTEADSIRITWPDGSVQRMQHVKADQTVALDVAQSRSEKVKEEKRQTIFVAATTDSIKHREAAYSDFDTHRLMYNMLSTQGPAFAAADLNGDGLEDFYLGGSEGNEGQLILQRAGGRFERVPESNFPRTANKEETSALFFDADHDGDQDLYVVTGGIETPLQSAHSADLFYENKGLSKGLPLFELSTRHIPAIYQSGSCVRAADFDKDGDLDLFVGTRVNPAYYGRPCDQFLLVNKGGGVYEDLSATLAPEFSKLGMVTDAAWFDYDGNGFPDLMIVGDWMPATLFLNDGKGLKKSATPGLDNTAGCWNTVSAGDLDGDGDTDFVLGNLGLNSKFKPTVEHPITLLVNDFDQNGSMEPIYSFEQGGKLYPYALRQDMVRQMSSLKKKFLYYKDYANKSIDQIFDATLVSNATTLVFTEGRTAILFNEGSQGFSLQPLPVEAQFSPVYGIALVDYDADKDLDIIMGGNLYAVKPEVGRYDAMKGLVLRNDGERTFVPLSSLESGIKVNGEIRHIVPLKSGTKTLLAFVRNNQSIVFYKSSK